MILGLNVFAQDVFAYTESSQFKVWTQVCTPDISWEKIPPRESTITRCDDAIRNRNSDSGAG